MANKIKIWKLSFLGFGLFAAFPCLADDWNSGWNISQGCPSTGTSFSGSVFTADGSTGFTGSGSCSRTSTGFTKFSFTSSAGGTTQNSTLYGYQSGDVLILPPVLSTETAPVFAVSTACPIANKTLNWVYVQWGSGTYSLQSGLVFGVATYDLTTGVNVTGRYNVLGGSVISGSVALPGSCTGGKYTLSGSGDRSGGILFAYDGNGVFKTAASRAILFSPQYTVTPSTDFGSKTFRGMLFNSIAAANTRNVTASADAAGTTLTINPYSDPFAGTLDSSGSGFTDTVTFTSSNSPASGILLGTVSRTPYGSGTVLGTGKIVCVAQNDGIQAKLTCSGETPTNNSYPYTMTLSATASEVLGQPTPNSNTKVETGLYQPNSVIVAGGKVIAADTQNQRILIWNSIPTVNQTAPNVVLGQAQYGTTGYGTSSSTLHNPYWVASDGTKLFVSDTGNNRILIWNTIPTVSQTPANTVVGQPDMTSNSSGLSSQALNNPKGVSTDGTRLFVSDEVNNRVLIWNSIPTTNGKAADLVLGQANMTSGTANSPSLSAKTLGNPNGVYVSGTRLYVADAGNNRVLIWNTLPTASQAAASLVLGQANMTTSTSATTSTTLSTPQSVMTDGTNLYVGDVGNHRVLIWTSLPTVNQKAANLVLGQANLTSKTNYAPSSTSIFYPTSVYSTGAKLLVTGNTDSRILIWNTLPGTSNKAADVVLGQPNLTTGTANTVVVSGQTLNTPFSAYSDGTKIYVADTANNRVLVWNSAPTSNQTAADLVLGQANMTSGNYVGVMGNTDWAPYAITSDGTRLYVADYSANRILVWNSIPTINRQSADLWLGQTGQASYGNSLSQTSVGTPTSLSICGTNLFSADPSHNRIMMWSSLPTAVNQAADYVLGQADFTSGGIGVTSQTLQAANGVFCDGSKVYVADYGNSRVLIWNSIPTANGVAADVVLGQPDMTSNYVNYGGVSASSMSGPQAVYSDGTSLYVADSTNNRILVWKTIPTTNLKAADAVLGQPDFTTTTSTISNRGLYNPTSISPMGTRLLVVDGYNRVLFMPTP